MSSWKWGAAVVAAAGGIIALASCAKDDCSETATCAGATATTTSDAGGDSGRVYPPVPAPAGCTYDADPKDQLACISDTYALFVDGALGNDSNAGTRAAPLKSIGAATNIDRLAGRQRIYVCASSNYDEHVVLPPSVGLIGGFACGSWQYVGTPTAMKASTSGLVVRITQGTSTVTVSDFNLTAADGTPGAESSVAMFIYQTTTNLHRVQITAGKGISPAAWTGLTSNKVTARDGISVDAGTPGAAQTCECALSGSSTTGAGGAPGQAGTAGSADPDPDPSTPEKNGGTGGANPTNGRIGLAGRVGAGGGPALKLGVLDANLGWVGGAGEGGEGGGPGRGGGGGGGGSTFGGGGGGCGGCGGNGGRGGKPGGSSIALAALLSNVALFDCTLTADTPGNGAAGENGETGYVGGQAGTAGIQASNGGKGGPGAGGGGGGGGSAGISVAVVFSGGGIQPNGASTKTASKNGSPGIGGPGGLPDATNAIPQGAQGQAGLTAFTTTAIYDLLNSH